MNAFSRLVKPLRYDVFISFRGPDTRYNFTGNLYIALNPLFKTFMDDREINKGFQITEELLEAIRMSRIYIIVLSKNFASSKPCMMEIVHILREYEQGKGRSVLPVFYDVDPSNVAATYKEALDFWNEQFSENVIDEWRIALTKLSEFHYFHLNRNENIAEYKHIKNILKEVSRHITRPIGIFTRMFKVNNLLSSGSDRVRVIGICGKAGIGKTTVVRQVYNCNSGSGFDHYCLFYDGEEVSNNALSKLKGKKVFIVFEDIKDSKQLENIKKLIEHLGSGSNVIITAEDRHLLERYEIGSIYDVESFSPTEANTLLAFKAFNSTTVKSKYLDIVNRIQICALGHPQTLELIGSKLSGKSFEERESVSRKYESMTDRGICKILEESFNDLSEHQQDMLIYIASDCKELELVQVEAKLRNKYQHCPRIDIRVLLDNSLIKINQRGQLTLHTSTLKMIEDEVEARKHGQRSVVNQMKLNLSNMTSNTKKHFGIVETISNIESCVGASSVQNNLNGW